jgi:hypothetical protein
LEEQIRSQNRARKYLKKEDSPAFVRSMSLQECRDNAASFDKLCRELEARLLQPPAQPGPPDEAAPPPEEGGTSP